MKHRASPALCERCDRKINDQTGWGVMMVCSVQAQPNVIVRASDREQSLLMCGYCFHELAKWLAPDVEQERA
jgi:hypothetical protein